MSVPWHHRCACDPRYRWILLYSLMVVGFILCRFLAIFLTDGGECFIAFARSVIRVFRVPCRFSGIRVALSGCHRCLAGPVACPAMRSGGPLAGEAQRFFSVHPSSCVPRVPCVVVLLPTRSFNHAICVRSALLSLSVSRQILSLQVLLYAVVPVAVQQAYLCL